LNLYYKCRKYAYPAPVVKVISAASLL